MPAGGAGVNFVWTCTLDDSASTSSARTRRTAGRRAGPRPARPACCPRRRRAERGHLEPGSNTAAAPGETLTSGYTAGVFASPGNNKTTFRSTSIDAGAWAAQDRHARHGEAGRRAHDRRRRNDLRPPRRQRRRSGRYDAATSTWTALANTRDERHDRRRARLPERRRDEYVYATMGNGTAFRRYTGVATDTWTAMASAPANIKDGRRAHHGRHQHLRAPRATAKDVLPLQRRRQHLDDAWPPCRPTSAGAAA